MPELKGSRRKLQVAIAAMVAADVVAMAVFFSPLVGSAESRRINMSQLSAELNKKTREVEPLHGVDKKIVVQGSDQSVLQGPLCGARFRSHHRTGEARLRKRSANHAGEI